MTKTRVFIVLKEQDSGSEFVGVFFDRPSAEKWISECKRPTVYFIETYEQPESGGIASEVWD
jgi:hypothetical protein